MEDAFPEPDAVLIDLLPVALPVMVAREFEPVAVMLPDDSLVVVVASSADDEAAAVVPIQRFTSAMPV